VVDVNSNPANPIIGYRSFGSNVKEVTDKSLAYMNGLQDHGVMAVAKHFPGHGDASMDSHLTLPIISRNRKELEDVEIQPFRSLVDNGVMGIMSAHLYLPALDTNRNRPSSVSPKIITKLLRSDLDFQGLAFTDALNMKGAANYLKPGELEFLALKAGNDMLLCPENVPVAYDYLLNAIAQGNFSERELNQHVRRILLAKYWTGLNHYSPLKPENLYKDLHAPHTIGYIEEVFAKAATLVKNDNNVLPIKKLKKVNFASISINDDNSTDFNDMLDNYAQVSHFSSGKDLSNHKTDSLLRLVKGSNMVFVAIHGIVSRVSTNYNISTSVLSFISKLTKQNKVALIVFGNPYCLKNFANAPVVLAMYEDNSYSNRIAAQILFGAIPSFGKLPVTVPNAFAMGQGITTRSLNRLTYRHPSAVAMNASVLDDIDDIALNSIAGGVTPGMQILVAKDGTVIYQKAFGTMSYKNTKPVNTKTNYDLASLSKTTATLLVIQYLNTNNLVNNSLSLANYLPYLANHEKGSITLQQLLEHRAGLQPFIPFYKKSLEANGFPSELWYSPTSNFLYDVPVANKMYGLHTLPDSIRNWIIDSPRLPKLADGSYPYKYSDFSFYFLQQVAEQIIKEPIDKFVKRQFFDSLGAYSLRYNPLLSIPDSNIAPTEKDTVFRHILLRGTVHDQLAALQGGVGGHAGLFGTANDVAKVMQLQLNGGNYGGTMFLPMDIVESYQRVSSAGSYRGLGWDKPQLNNANNPTSVYASPETFGHTGFTGTCAWADPKYKLVFVFLSNRICPDANNKKITEQSVRPRIMDVIYRSMMDGFPLVTPLANGMKKDSSSRP